MTVDVTAIVGVRPSAVRLECGVAVCAQDSTGGSKGTMAIEGFAPTRPLTPANGTSLVSDLGSNESVSVRGAEVVDNGWITIVPGTVVRAPGVADGGSVAAGTGSEGMVA
jgi:hypothetical protein